jgi:hypothetical protein
MRIWQVSAALSANVTEAFYDFLQSLNENTEGLSSNRPRLSPSNFLPLSLSRSHFIGRVIFAAETILLNNLTANHTITKCKIVLSVRWNRRVCAGLRKFLS